MADVSTPAPPVASQDAAWVTLPLPQPPGTLAVLCNDIEAIFRVNPYLYFSVWRQTGPNSYHAEFENQSNQQNVTVDMEIAHGPDIGFTINYGSGIKKRTVFAIAANPAGGSLLTITDDYEALPEAERNDRAAEVDKSLHAWGVALRAYFMRLKRWSWLPGWRWYIRRMWIPMKPSARRVVWLLCLITAVEFLFFLFVLLIYLIEHRGN